jgi:hypothetical protein
LTALFCVLFSFVMMIPDLTHAEPAYQVTAGRAEGVQIDGFLEAAWLQGGVAEGFVPHYPDPISQRTLVYLLSDQNALFVGFMCYDTAPDSIMGCIQRRDNDSRSDFVDIYLDSFHDRRNGYWYTVTAAGVQAEGTFANENEFSSDWDAVWESAVAKCDSGWMAEFRIPFQSIRHGGARDDGWGIAFARRIQRTSEFCFWPPVDPNIDFHIGSAAVLYGLNNIASSSHIEVLPHAVGRWDAEPVDGKWHSENEIENLGFYIKAVPNAAMTLDFAYQPDFAQVDVDAEVINLEDYPVFFPEKRPFFLESKQIFEEIPYTLFYSRRITDPDYAGRTNFQKGNFRASILAGKNRRPDAILKDDILQDAVAGRGVWNLGRAHRIGLTSTYLNQDGYSARAGAVDARLRWRERDYLMLWAAGVDRSGDGARWSERGTPVSDINPMEARIYSSRDLGFAIWDLALTYRGTDYDIDDLGWNDYSNVMREAIWFYKKYFPSTTFVRDIGYDLYSHTETFTDNTHREARSYFDAYFDTRSNLNAGFGMEWKDDFRRNYSMEDGEFRDNFGQFNTEYYRGWRHWTWFNSDNRLPVEYRHDFEYSTFRDGRSIQYAPTLLWKPRSNIEISETLSWFRIWDVADFADKTLDYQVWSTKLQWSPRLNVSVRATVQYCDNPEPEQPVPTPENPDPEEIKSYDNLLTNLLLAWNWSPGSWFYLVYDEAGRPVHPAAYDQPGGRTIRAKLTYFFTVP